MKIKKNNNDTLIVCLYADDLIFTRNNPKIFGDFNQARNPVFHDKRKHIDRRFHYLQDYIANKKVKVKNMKTQNQVTNIFTKSLKYDVFIKIKDVLGVMKKSSLRGVENKSDFGFEKKRNRSTG